MSTDKTDYDENVAGWIIGTQREIAEGSLTGFEGLWLSYEGINNRTCIKVVTRKRGNKLWALNEECYEVLKKLLAEGWKCRLIVSEEGFVDDGYNMPFELWNMNICRLQAKYLSREDRYVTFSLCDGYHGHKKRQESNTACTSDVLDNGA